MQRMAGTSTVEGILVDWVAVQPEPAPRLPASWLSREKVAARLQLIQRNRAREAAEEAELILRLAELSPDDADPAADHPGARKRGWTPAADRPGASEFFVSELSMVLNCGRSTASWRARRAWVWRESLPLTFAALRAGRIDERRAQELFDALQDAAPASARRVEATLLPEATSLSLGRLRRRACELLLELDPRSADENRERAQQHSDVFVEPRPDGRATLGADLPADQTAEAYDLIDQLARMAKADGDDRPIGQLRSEVFSMLLRSPGSLTGARATLTITAALDALDGSSTAPGDVNGFAITPAHLRELLHRIGALGLEQPDGGSVAFALIDESGRLLATVGLAELRGLVRRGQGLHPPPATDAYRPTTGQRRLVTTRDRTCRFPNCGRRAGWADLDHVIPHACGGETDCANLCCLCRSHHRLKTFAPGWRFVMDPDGTLHVTTPSGVTRTTRPWALRRHPPLGPAPARAAPEEPPPF